MIMAYGTPSYLSTVNPSPNQILPQTQAQSNPKASSSLFNKSTEPRSTYYLLVMTFNQIINKKIVGKVIKDGAPITLSVATETSSWRRAEVAVGKVGDVLTKSVENWQEPLPNDTKEVCSR